MIFGNPCWIESGEAGYDEMKLGATGCWWRIFRRIIFQSGFWLISKARKMCGLPIHARALLKQKRYQLYRQYYKAAANDIACLRPAEMKEPSAQSA